jgi:hypothetical protein
MGEVLKDAALNGQGRKAPHSGWFSDLATERKWRRSIAFRLMVLLSGLIWAVIIGLCWLLFR